MLLTSHQMTPFSLADTFHRLLTGSSSLTLSNTSSTIAIVFSPYFVTPLYSFDSTLDEATCCPVPSCDWGVSHRVSTYREDLSPTHIFAQVRNLISSAKDKFVHLISFNLESPGAAPPSIASGGLAVSPNFFRWFTIPSCHYYTFIHEDVVNVRTSHLIHLGHLPQYSPKYLCHNIRYRIRVKLQPSQTVSPTLLPYQVALPQFLGLMEVQID